MTTAVTSGGATSLARRILPVLAGPAILLITLAIPFFGPLPARFGFGILFWMVYWWVGGTVDIKVSCLVPLLVAAAYPFMPVDKVLPELCPSAYAADRRYVYGYRWLGALRFRENGTM